MTSLSQGIPPAVQIRQELEQMVLADLLGPANGPDEEITEDSVRDRYLIGMLAPKRQELTPEEFDELPQGGAGGVEEGPLEYTAPTAATMFPSSFGMTFCIGIEAEAIKITAKWGQYSREHSETLKEEKTGNPKRVWKRKQREGVSDPLVLKPGRITPWSPDPEFLEVQVQGMVRKRDHFWSVTLFLVNGQDEPKTKRDAAWLFQPELIVESPDGKPIFYSRAAERQAGKSDPALFAEDQELAMLYRHEVEFGTGHGVGIHADRPAGAFDRAVRISTRVAPAYEVAKSTPPRIDELPALNGLVLDMKDLGETVPTDFHLKLNPLLKAYETWISAREADLASSDMAGHKSAGRSALDRCRRTLERIKEGVNLLASNEMAADAFRFANLAMWQQRVRTIYSERRRRDEKADLSDIDIPANRSWYPFQLAFVLLNLPGLTLLDHSDRTGGSDATADLLWFPTGGGKTEAYLGLTAYTIAIRRLQANSNPQAGSNGSTAGTDGPWNRSSSGVAVLMRYTLRLLTIQQFQRATALICASEILRRGDEAKWGAEPFRIGLWVGQKTTPNTTEQAAESIQQEHGQRGFRGRGGGSPAQLTNCPWCGSKIDPGRDIKVETYARGRSRTLTYCGDPLGRCPFTAKNSAAEGIPVLVVDEEIYRRLPALLIATVDKFAQMPWNGKVEMLFGQVDSYCDRHGFRSPEIEDADSHPKRDRMPAVKTIARSPLRPPDLIIQDELHLISDALGSMVGLYETVIDRLCSRPGPSGATVRPVVVASTATVRRAADQAEQVFARKLAVFPPPVLDIGDTFFSTTVDPSPSIPGRRYRGVLAPGERLKSVEI
ncbi:MAG TPA: helicase, partial [Blastocatellia bacterium]